MFSFIDLYGCHFVINLNSVQFFVEINDYVKNFLHVVY